jgi:hypothetical protein
VLVFVMMTVADDAEIRIHERAIVRTFQVVGQRTQAGGNLSDCLASQDHTVELANQRR